MRANVVFMPDGGLPFNLVCDGSREIVHRGKAFLSLGTTEVQDGVVRVLPVVIVFQEDLEVLQNLPRRGVG